MNKILKHPVVSTVVGSLIFTFILWLFGLIPLATIWQWLKGVIAKLLTLLNIVIEIPLWVFLVIIPALIVFRKFIFPKLKTLFLPAPEPIEEYHQSAIVEQTPDQIELTEDEQKVLELLVSKDGASIEYRDLNNRLRLPRLKAEQIIESLSDLGLAIQHENYFSGPHIRLTKKGRDLILGNKYKRT